MDGYRWFQNGTKKLPRSEPVISKIHFVSTTPSGHRKEFQRHAYKVLRNDSTNKVVVHYIGDESVSCKFPHGNSRSNMIYHRSCKSLLHRLSSCHDSPEVVYKNLVSENKCPPEYQPSLVPRNSKQVANVQYKERQKSRL